MKNLRDLTEMTGIVILAAGSSSRLGRPKQNLVFEGETLLQRIIKRSLAVANGPVIVVLGGNADLIKETIGNFPITIIYNADWQKGMSSSIKAGINELQKTEADSVILALCDQPFIDEDLLTKLVSGRSADAIAACSYNNTIGTPAFFGSKYFSELLDLNGSEGAKHLLMRYGKQVRTVPFSLGHMDIDTIEDFERLKNF